MKINEVTNIEPKTTQQLRVDSLKRQKENISKQLKAERNRQKISKAQQTIADLKNQH